MQFFETFLSDLGMTHFQLLALQVRHRGGLAKHHAQLPGAPIIFLMS